MRVISGSLSTTFNVPQKRIAELIATTLPQVNWKILQFNEDGRTCSAEHTIDLGGGIGQPNVYNYSASLEWDSSEDDPDKYKLRISVSEKNSKSSETECKTLCAEFFRRAKQILARLVANPLPARITYGSAHWATLEELATIGYLVDDESDNLDPKSYIVGPLPENKLLAIPPEQSVMHSVVCGSTGTGKTTGFILPQAIKRLNISGIFTEATDGSNAPAVYSQSARWRAEKGNQDIYYFNPGDLSSNQINLVSLIKTPEDAGVIANIIISNTTQTHNKSGQDFWEKAEQYLVNALLLHAAGEKSNIAAIRRLVQKGAKGLDEVLSQSVYQRARDEYQGFLNTGSDNTRDNVFIGLLQRLTPWSYPIVEKITERTDIDMIGLRERLFSFYLAVSASADHLKPVVSLVLNYLLDVVLEANKKDAAAPKYPLMLVLDEFTNFGRIPGFEKKIAIIRHRGVGVTLGFQDIRQLYDTYGQDVGTWIMNQPGTRIFLRPRDLLTAENITKQLGKRTHYERKVNSSGNLVETELALDLMNPGEVMSIAIGKAILFTPNSAPLMIDCFKWQDFKDAYTMPPWQRRMLEAETELVRASSSHSSASGPDEREFQRKKQLEHDRLNDERPPDY